MGYLVYAYYNISPTRYYKDDSCLSADLKSKTTEDIISIRIFMEVLVVNMYLLGKYCNLPFVAQTDYAFLNKISEHATESLSELTVTPASKSLELSTNVASTTSVIALEQNEEWVNDMVDGSDYEMTDVVGSEHVSSGPSDVVVAYSVGEKGDGSLPSSVVDEEAAANPFERILNHATSPNPNGFHLGPVV
nr:hypothetical protein [Tanacetum cinerariifolium]